MNNRVEVQPPIRIAVIIPVWNGLQHLPDCLDSLSKQQGVSFDVFAVDNASNDGSPAYISEQWPAVRLIRNKSNLGFSRACNLAIEAASDHSILVLLNQDTEVLPDWLAELVAPLQRDESIGITGSKAYYSNGIIEHAGGAIDKRGIGRHIGRGEPDRGQFSTPRKVDYVSGASLAIRREVLEAVGALDEEFSPAYYEDVDWCYRARSEGHQVVYAPRSRLIHKASSTLLDGTPEAEFALHRNRLRFVLKHFSLHKLVDDFMPAEQIWLASLGPSAEQMRLLLHRAYLHQLIRLAGIVDARQASFRNSAEETNGLAPVLLGLRAIYPAHTNPEDTPVTRTGSPPELPAVSTGLLVRVLHGFQRRYPRTSQSVLSTPLTQPLVQFANQQQLAKTLIDYLRENSREVAELAREIERDKERIGQVPDGAE